MISNAIKYTQHGFVRVICAQEPEKGLVKFIVEDTGVGIEKEQIESLFTAFTKIMTNRNLNKQGVGLGLTISKNLAIALGGDINVESYLGAGSKFTVLLPLENLLDIDQE